MNNMKIGYIRVSTEEQKVDRQVDLLLPVCDEIQVEKRSAVGQSRPVFKAVLQKLDAGDTLVVWSLDRAFRSARDALNIEAHLKERGVTLRIVSLGVDTATADGKLAFTMVAAVAEGVTMSIITYQGYSAGHPWYYLLGGEIPSIRAIRTCAISGKYAGCSARLIGEADVKAEPKRTEALRYLRNRVLEDLRCDISRYRQCVRELRKWREKNGAPDKPDCSGVHTAISLKFNHILNDFATLHTLDRLPKQGHLFELF